MPKFLKTKDRFVHDYFEITLNLLTDEYQQLFVKGFQRANWKVTYNLDLMSVLRMFGVRPPLSICIFSLALINL